VLEFRRGDVRGIAAFGQYCDPRHMDFSDLRGINDDCVKGGEGLRTHAHRDMDIFTYMLEGLWYTKDAMGRGSVIPSADVRMMSAGRI
jgi:redox-sensitive bicupin YhaK (pirin superfamily)